MPVNNGEQAGDDQDNNFDFEINTRGFIEMMACLLIISIGMAAPVMCWIVALEMHTDLVEKHMVHRGESGTWLIRKVIRNQDEL